jgi:hypothetical protein
MVGSVINDIVTDFVKYYQTEFNIAAPVLPKWLFFAIPIEMTGYYANDNPKYHYVQLNDPKVRPNLERFGPIKNYFVTGGSVCQVVFEREPWQCDFDIWTEKSEYDKIRSVEWYPGAEWYSGAGGEDFNVDFVVADPKFGDGGKLERCIERFDFSVVQQGVKNSKELYVNAVNILSRSYQKVIVNISEMTIQYNVGWRCSFEDYGQSCPGRRGVATALNFHLQQQCRSQSEQTVRNHIPFYDCSKCCKNKSLDTFYRMVCYLHCENNNCQDPESEFRIGMTRWLYRLKKYAARFSDMEFIYVCNKRF